MAVTGCRFNSEIPRIPAYDLSEEDFNLNYFKQAKPVIITGATTEWPAIRSWTISSLMEKVGNNEVLIRGKVNKDEYRSGKAYTIRKDTFYNYCSDILSDNARATLRFEDLEIFIALRIASLDSSVSHKYPSQ